MEISANSNANPAPADTRPGVEQAGLGRDAFLRIFMAQLKHQDPLSPQDTSELSAQLAQFSQLEQSVLMAEELRGVNRRLDELLTSNRGQANQALDPAGLIGREVEVASNGLRVADAGTSPALLLELAAPAQRLQIEVRDAMRSPVGLVQLRATTPETPLRAGSYQLFFSGSDPVLRFPDGSELPLEALRLVAGEDGFEVARDAEGHTAPYAFTPGASYRFGVAGSDAAGATLPVRTTTLGRVESVRTGADGLAITVNGQELDFSEIIRIR